MRELTDYEIGFVECALDTEGSIFLSKHFRSGRHYSPRAYFGCNNPLLVGKVADICGCGGRLYPAVKKGYTSSWGITTRKTVYRYELSRDEIDEILPQLQLIEKEEQRLLVIEASGMMGKGKGYHRYPPEHWERLEEIYQELKRLNEKG